MGFTIAEMVTMPMGELDAYMADLAGRVDRREDGAFDELLVAVSALQERGFSVAVEDNAPIASVMHD
jgi:hypothetical protein